MPSFASVVKFCGDERARILEKCASEVFAFVSRVEARLSSAQMSFRLPMRKIFGSGLPASSIRWLMMMVSSL